jgi:hypothetical protein
MEITLPTGDSVLSQLNIESHSISQIKVHWKRSHYRAAINWLTQYRPPLVVQKSIVLRN